jgi:hypothetical protein
MKYLVSLLLGVLVGVILFALALLNNPFNATPGLSPLAVTDSAPISLSYSPVPAENIVYTNDGESMHAPFPEKVQQFWERPISQTSALVTLLHDARGLPKGIGVKIWSPSETSRLIRGEAIADSDWYIYLPELGGMHVSQTENYWPFFREVMFPAWRSSADNWRGNWRGDTTAGPGALGTAPVSGTSGSFSGIEMEAAESLSVKAFSVQQGFVAAEGRLLIATTETEPALD